MKRKDLTGIKFERLTVVEYHSTDKAGRARWRCVCNCNKEVIVMSNNLLSNHTKSCGCIRKFSPGYTTDGKKTRLYCVWSAMKDRCGNPRHASYEYYGGKGVYVCIEWLDFIPFHEWAINNGYKNHLTIDRINSKKGYFPTNCRWVSRQIQAMNRGRKKGTGVYWDARRKKWRGRFNLKGKEIFCGYFKSYSKACVVVKKQRESAYRDVYFQELGTIPIKKTTIKQEISS